MSVFNRFKQSPIVVTDGVQPAATSDANPITPGEKSDKSAYGIDTAPMENDIEMQKPVVTEVKIGEQGAQRIELMQQVWGRHGKKYIFVA